METREHDLELCTICNDFYTDSYTEIRPGVHVFVCENCVEAARYNYMWFCMHCGKVYLRPKKTVISCTDDEEHGLYEEKNVIQAIETCHECDPKGLIRFVTVQTAHMEC